MRYIVYGVGAIGGTFAGALMQAGFPVIGIARGAMLAAIARDGLRFRTPAGDARLRLPVVGAPSEIGFAADDVILLTTKSQDTAAAVLALRDAGVAQQAVICAQNGVANERAALRLFPNVYGMTVRMPSDYTVPGEVICYGEPKHGLLDLGRYPGGSDAVVDSVAAELETAGFAVATTAGGSRRRGAGNGTSGGEAGLARCGDHRLARCQQGQCPPRRRDGAWHGGRGETLRRLIGPEPQAGRRQHRDRLSEWRDRAARAPPWRADAD